MVDFPIHGEKSAGGLSLLGAMGYELGVTPRLALGGGAHDVAKGTATGRFLPDPRDSARAG